MKKEIYPSINYRLNTYLKPEEPLDSLISIHGEASVYTGPDDDLQRSVIARVHYYHAQLDREGLYPAWETLEGATAETAEFACLFEENTSHWTHRLLEMVLDADICHHSLLILDRIQVLPAYRGQGLSYALIDDALRTFAPNTQVLALKCFPLQLEHREADRDMDPAFAKQMALDELPQDSEAATARLQAYYEALGFRCYNEDGVMAASRWEVKEALDEWKDEVTP